MTALAWLLAFASGFLSLSEEILWVRVIGFQQQGLPHAFALVLSFYLLGIASGAAVGKRICQRWNEPLPAAAVAMALAGVLGLVTPSAMASLAQTDPLLRTWAPLLLMAASASAKAVVFPIAHHIASSNISASHLGRSLSAVYGMNIAGSTLGPLLTGFVLLDHVGVDAAFQGIGAGCLLMAAMTLIRSPGRIGVGAIVALAGAGVVAAGHIDTGRNDILNAFAQGSADAPVRSLLSNRHGVIHTIAGRADDDMVYGGNVYDGRTNVSLVSNSNRIDRAYLLGALHERPRRVAVIGLSTGAWLQVVSRLPGVETVDVVEINPGYLQLIAGYKHLAPMLKDPRIRIHIDDGRRWMRRHREEHFDLIVMNTTFHWRANSTNLLSHQFLAMARARLAPGGILAFNTTSSPDAVHTAATVFPHAYLWRNFVYAAEHDFRAALNDPLATQRLRALGQPDARAESELQSAVDQLLSRRFETVSEVRARAGRELEVIDDARMQTEFRYGWTLMLQ